jgi:uncharacterized protein YkwD
MFILFKEFTMGRLSRQTLPALLAALILSACGGGGGGDSTTASAPQSTSALLVQEPNAPRQTGDTATDGLNWFNFRRQQAGVQAVSRNPELDVAAQGHSNYQALNDTITHVQAAGNPGFTGATVKDRVLAANYPLPPDQPPTPGYAVGEVIAATYDASGANAAENLVTAIYHRFGVLEPMYRDAGTAAVTAAGGRTYFTADFGVIGLSGGLGRGNVVVYPFSGQDLVPLNFFSDNELPDPVPGRNEVGYPISVHADILYAVTVQSFTVKPRGGQPLTVRLLDNASDPNMQTLHVDSAAAIVPLAPLQPATTYDVQFLGTAGGLPITKSWSFTTR